MINKKLIDPSSIVIIGGSNDIHKPGGKVLKNLLDSKFLGDIYVVNPKEDVIQGKKCYKDVKDLPKVDLAIISVPAKFTLDIVSILTKTKSTQGFIILSAGYSEMGELGKKLEQEIVSLIEEVDGSLIGPNCIGLLTSNYNGTFTEPVPQLSDSGCDFVSGSGATAVFILESAVSKGVRFNSIFSVGNSAQVGVEEVVKFWDESFDVETSSKVKLLYIENIDKPDMLLKHAASLVKKGCKIAAIKAGSSSAGSRAASSHTGALASSDVAVNALFKKAGIIRCYGREDLITTASILLHPELKGKNIAIITHAGGPGVMLTDALSNNNLQVPPITSKEKDNLLKELFPGSTVNNPIDFLATGTADQLGIIIDYCESKFDEIDGMAVIFGTPGLFQVYDAYKVLDEKMKTCKKPIYPILPSTVTAKGEIDYFLEKGRINFPDEVVFGEALAKVFYTDKPEEIVEICNVDTEIIRGVINNSENGYLEPGKVQVLLDAAGINRAKEAVAIGDFEAERIANEIGFPLVMKVVGPVHKSDIGGVKLNITSLSEVKNNFKKLMDIKDATGVLFQPMLSGTELFVGAKYEDKFGHLVLMGMGGIFIEVLKDVQSILSPVSKDTIRKSLTNLKSYKILEGLRGQEGINIEGFVDIIYRLEFLIKSAPEIIEMDLNPLLGNSKEVIAVDARIRIDKQNL